MDSNTVSPIQSTQRRDYIFDCRICGIGFADVQELLTHAEKHKGRMGDGVSSNSKLEKRMYSCVECPAKFDLYEDLQDHAKMHSDDKNSLLMKTSVSDIEDDSDRNDDLTENSRSSSFNKQKLTMNSDILERLKKRVSTMNYNQDDDYYNDPGNTEMVAKSLDTLKCQFCNKEFVRKDNIRKHLRTHTGEKPYHCPICPRRFACASSRKKHIRVHTGEKPYVCKVCGSRFSQSPSLKQHALNKHNMTDPALYVGQASESLSVHDLAALNMKKSAIPIDPNPPSQRKRSECKPCGLSFRTRDEYDNHSMLHKNSPGGIDLVSVKEEYPSSSSREQDQDYRPSSKKARQFCHYCNQTFSCNSSLSRHMRIHSGERPFKCSICSNTFTQGSTLKKHLQRVHMSEWAEMQRTNPFESRKFRTDVPEYVDQENRNGQKNESVNSKGCDLSPKLEIPDLNSFKCRYCQVQFANLQYLNDHEKTHTVPKPYACKWCGRCFGYKSHLKRHFLIHTGEKPHKCQYCNLRFRQKVSLNTHMRARHKDVLANTSTQHIQNAYTCDICKKTFQSSSALARHYTFHRGNPLKCLTCGKVFRKATTLKEHIRIHTGEKPCLCTICGLRYRCAVQLRRHLREHTQEELETMDDYEDDIENYYEVNMKSEQFVTVKKEEDFDGVNDEVNEENSYHKFFNEKREAVLVPLEPDKKEAVFAINNSNTTTRDNKNWMANFDEDDFGLVSDDDNFSNEEPAEEEDPPYLPCKANPRVKQSPQTAPVGFGSETLIKLSISMNTGKCCFCAKTFTSRSDMKRHLRTHTGEKPFECNVCSARFTQKKSLMEHKSTHTGERPHRCDICNMRFRYRSHLSRHIKRNLHYPEVAPIFDDSPSISTFSCIACNHEFYNLDGLRQHLEGVHGIGEDLNIADEICIPVIPSITNDENLSDIAKSIKVEALDDLQNGIGRLSSADLFTCDFCNTKFPEYEIWIKHLNSHTADLFS